MLVFLTGLAVAYVRLRRRFQKIIEKYRESARSEERNRLARDLHDGMGSALTQIALDARKALKFAQTSEADARLASIADSSSEALEKLDDIVWVTDPEEDSLASLLDHISDFSARFARTAEIQCRLNFPSQVPETIVSAPFRHHVFSAVKEAVRNVVRHANASTLYVRATISEADLEIVITDDGKGFSVGASETSTREGNGLKNIVVRIKAVGGNVKITSVPSEGTTVQINTPLERIDKWPQ
jgi:signal transduction histidine kinase